MRTQGRLETQPPWVEGAGAAAATAAQGRGLNSPLVKALASDFYV